MGFKKISQGFLETVEKVMRIGKKSAELLQHFNCGFCRKWWSVSEAPKRRKKWYCPWCGNKQDISNGPH